MEKLNLQKKSIFNNNFFVAVAALFCCALWGSATPFIKVGYELILPEKNTSSIILFAGVRFFFSGVLTVLIYSIARRKILYPKLKNLGKVAEVAAFQTVIQYIFFYIGLANTTGVKGTIASGSSAFFAILIAAFVFRMERLTVKKVVACIAGFAGIVLVNIDGLELTMNLTGDGFVIFGTISYSVASVLMKKYSRYEDPVVISGYQFVMGGIVMIIVGLCMGGVITMPSVKALSVLTYLSFLSAAAYSIWSVLLMYNPVSKVSIYIFMTPVLGVILSNLMLTEASKVDPINLILAMILISGGIIMLNYKKTEK